VINDLQQALVELIGGTLSAGPISYTLTSRGWGNAQTGALGVKRGGRETAGEREEWVQAFIEALTLSVPVRSASAQSSSNAAMR
jgi:hypothetical protein